MKDGLCCGSGLVIEKLVSILQDYLDIGVKEVKKILCPISLPNKCCVNAKRNIKIQIPHWSYYAEREK